MNITKRLYTYPVLSEEKSDYTSSIFDIDITYGTNSVINFFIELSIIMDNSELEDLIASGIAEYAVHIECTTTSYRTLVRSITKDIKINIPLSRINGKLEIVGLIILNKDIKNFRNSDWNEDYENITFNLNKGSILAYKNIPSIDILKNYEEFKDANSIFSVYKRLTKDTKPMDINLDRDIIGIGLSMDEFEIYSKFCKLTKFQPLLNSLIVFPALIYVFEELKQESGIENYEARKWFISMKNAYAKRNIDFVDEVLNEDKTSIQLAQEVMELPIQSAFIALNELFETEQDLEES